MCGGVAGERRKRENEEIGDKTRISTGLYSQLMTRRELWRRGLNRGKRTWHSSSVSVCGSVDQRCEGVLVELYFFLAGRRVRLQTGLLRVSVCRTQGPGG